LRRTLAVPAAWNGGFPATLVTTARPFASRRQVPRIRGFPRHLSCALHLVGPENAVDGFGDSLRHGPCQRLLALEATLALPSLVRFALRLLRRFRRGSRGLDFARRLLRRVVELLEPSLLSLARATESTAITAP
jgi:hypothetical protein